MTEAMRAVPDRPTAVLLDGDGVGPEVVALAREVVDAAVKRLYGGRRAISWLPMPCGSPDAGLPEATLAALATHRLALRGPFTASPAGAPSRAMAIGRALDLYTATLRLPRTGGELLLMLEASEGAAMPAEAVPSGVETDALLGALRRQLPAVATSVRFGTRERVESYLRSVGRRELALVETGLAIELLSREGVERFVEAALRVAGREQRRRVTLALDSSTSPHASTTFADVAYRVASERLPGVAVTHPDYRRASVRASEAAAEKLRDDALAGGLWLEPRTFASLCEEAADPQTLDLLCAPWSEGLLLAHLFAANSGGPAATAVVRENPESGAAVGETLHGTARALSGQGTADPTAAIRAGAQLFATAGWTELPAAVERALAQASAGGRARGASFAKTVIAALSR